MREDSRAPGAQSRVQDAHSGSRGDTQVTKGRTSKNKHSIFEDLLHEIQVVPELAVAPSLGFLSPK